MDLNNHLMHSLNEFKWFERISGLKINFDKIQVIWICSRKYSRRKLCQNWDLIWGKTSFKLLGIEFDVDLRREAVVKLFLSPFGWDLGLSAYVECMGSVLKQNLRN